MISINYIKSRYLSERFNRKEYILFSTPVVFVLYAGLSIERTHPNIFILCQIFMLAMFVPYIMVTAKRMHDLNISGWWQLLFTFSGWSQVTILGMSCWLPWAQWLLLPLFFLKGTPGTNRYGEPPKD